MAIVQNFWLKGSKKRLGGAVLYKAMGQTRSRELASEVSNPRTVAQMTQRIKWSNLVNFYRANQSWMKYAFETKKTNQSEYNKFMSLNVTGSPIALTQEAASSGACVAGPYIVTQGSLPSIEWTDTPTEFVSNLFYTSGALLEEDTTVGEFSRGIIENNPAIQVGDQLSFIRVTQMVNASTGFPYIIVRKYEVIMDTTSTNYLSNFIPYGILSTDEEADNNPIKILKHGRQGGFAMILSRTTGGKTYVSSQSLVVVGNDPIISRWSSPEAIAEAIASYGESEDAFLSSTSAQQSQNIPVPLNITSVTIDGVNYTPLALTPTYASLGGKRMTINFNGDVGGASSIDQIATAFTRGKAVDASIISASGNAIVAQFPPAEVGVSNQHLVDVTVSIGPNDYTIDFADSSKYSDEGFE